MVGALRRTWGLYLFLVRSVDGKGSKTDLGVVFVVGEICGW